MPFPLEEKREEHSQVVLGVVLVPISVPQVGEDLVIPPVN